MSLFSNLVAKFDFPFLKKLGIQIAQTAGVAGALAGLTVAGDQVPVIADHYGISAQYTAQIIILVGTARAFVSGLNN